MKTNTVTYDLTVVPVVIVVKSKNKTLERSEQLQFKTNTDNVEFLLITAAITTV